MKLYIKLLVVFLLIYGIKSYAIIEVPQSGTKDSTETDKVSILTYKFVEGSLNWTVRNFPTLSTNVDQWYWRDRSYYALPGGAWFTNNRNGGSSDIRNTMIYSPVIDLVEMEEVELYIHTIDTWARSENNKFWLYVQTSDNLNLDITDDTLFIQQWGAMKINMDAQNNYADLGLSSTSYNEYEEHLNNCGPLDLAMFDGQKIRIALHFWNEDSKSATYKHIGVSEIKLEGIKYDSIAPIGTIQRIDSVGNTFMRAWYNADEVAKVYWAIMPKGQSPASFDDLKNNIGSGQYINSGSFDFNVPGMSKAFFIDGLEIDSEYTITYSAEDMKGNVSALQTVDKKTINDLIAPVISKFEVSDVSEITAKLSLQADELGNIHYRIYNTGFEPENFEQFMSGTGSVKRGIVPFDNPENDKVWDINYLNLNTQYIAYATVTDMTGNVSEIAKSDPFKTLADTKKPVINSLAVMDVANYEVTLNLTSDEPRDGFGGAICYWSVTEKDTVLSGDDIINKVAAFRSGKANLDSATYLNEIGIDRLNKNTDYQVHAVVVDGSNNISEPQSLTFKTDNESEDFPLFVQEFDVENKDYHFVDVVNVSGFENEPHWMSKPDVTENDNLGLVHVENKGIDNSVTQEAWCMIGPIDLSKTGYIRLHAEYMNNWGNYEDHLTLWISKKYKGDSIVNLNDWIKVSQEGDFPSDKKKWIEKDFYVDNALLMDTVGVYIGFRFHHSVYAHEWNIYSLKLYGNAYLRPPFINKVETAAVSDTSALISYSATNFGTAFCYLLKDDGTGVIHPTFKQVVTGEGADNYASFHYTSENGAEEKFTIVGLQSNTKYHLFSAFRNLRYDWADSVYYNSQMSTFKTTSTQSTPIKLSQDPVIKIYCVNDQIEIFIPSGICFDIETLTLYNVAGQEVYSSPIKEQEKIQIRGLKSGIYLYRLSGKANKVYTGKFVSTE